MCTTVPTTGCEETCCCVTIFHAGKNKRDKSSFAKRSKKLIFECFFYFGPSSLTNITRRAWCEHTHAHTHTYNRYHSLRSRPLDRYSWHRPSHVSSCSSLTNNNSRARRKIFFILSRDISHHNIDNDIYRERERESLVIMAGKKASPSSSPGGNDIKLGEEHRSKSVTWANESKMEEVVEYEVSQYEQSDLDSLDFRGGDTGGRYRSGIRDKPACCCTIMW